MQRQKLSWSGARRWTLRGLLFVSALSTGCGQEGLESDAALEQQQQAAEQGEVSRPQLASLTAIPQEELHDRSRTLLEATLVPGQKGVTEVVVDSDTGEPSVLRDDGLSGDLKAGDGVFSGLSVVNFKDEIAHNQRIAEFSARFGDELVKATFDGREVVKQEPLRAQPAELFKPFNRIPLEPLGISFAIDPARSLLIRHSSVVNDPIRTYNPCTNTGNTAGVWTFNHLMTEMANQPATGITPATFTRRWLKHWEANQNVNFWNVPARPAMLTKIINPWPKLTDGSLDMARSPFKLVAIVNRLDLGKGTGPAAYGSRGAGELRFVFAAVDRSAGTCTVSPFLVIFEYGVPKTACPAVKSWAQQWANLSLITLGTAAFNPALEALTQQVVVRNAAPGKPNGNAINQIRTNENMLNPLWELREFRLFASGATPNHLSQHTMALTPGLARNNTADLASFINANTPAILANNYTVPLDWPVAGTNFLGGNALVASPPSTVFWKAPGIVNNNARHKFSFNTCDGCHGGEMATPFTHISWTGALSPFLSGPLTKTDPAVTSVSRTFNEMLMRQQHLNSVASQSCLSQAVAAPSALVH